MTIPRVVAWVAPLALLAAGCGVPGPPVPPTPKIPQPPTDLVAEQQGERVLLRWTRPRLHADGTRLEAEPTIEIHRAFLDDGTEADQQFDQRARVVYVLPAQVVESFRHGEIVVFPDVLGSRRLGEQSGRTVVYALKAVNKKGQDAGFSHRVALRLHPVPTPVEEIATQVTERAIRLRWPSPTRTTSGTPLEAIAGYQIYRSATGEDGSFAQVGTTAAATYEDTNITLGQTYFYRVTTLAQFGTDTVESVHSASAEVLAEDRFPPAAPAGLIAVAGPAQANLTWDASEAADLAGYYIYRSRESGAGFERLHAEPLQVQNFTDRQVEPGVPYYYVVTAVDASGNESGYSNQITVAPLTPD